MLPIVLPVTPPPTKDDLEKLSSGQLDAAVDCTNMPYAAVVAEFLKIDSGRVFFDKHIFVNAQHCKWFWLIKYYTNLEVSYQYDTRDIGYIAVRRDNKTKAMLVICRADQKASIVEAFAADKDRSYSLCLIWGDPNRDGTYEVFPIGKGKSFTLPIWGFQDYFERNSRPTTAQMHSFNKKKQAIADGLLLLRRTAFKPTDDL